MKTKQILIAIGILLLFACNNEDSVESVNFEDSAYGVVGRWYTECNVDDPLFNMYGEYVFTGNGAIYADEYRKINGYRRSELRGTYNVDKDNISTEFGINEGGKSTHPLKVTNGLTFVASFHRFSEDYTLNFIRIVGEIVLSVDSTLNVEANVKHNIGAYTSQQVEIKGFEMTDEAIASVDDSGIITAKLMGISFMKVKTSIGTAVLKISVSDKENLWNNFSQLLGKNFDEVEMILGKHYAIRNDSLIRYFYDNPYVDSVDIFNHGNMADSIIVTMRTDASHKNIINNLANHFKFIKDTLSYHWFTNSENYLFSTSSIKYYEDSGKLVYLRQDPQWDDRVDDYGMTEEELLEKYEDYSGTKGNTLSFYGLKNEFVGKITYYLNPTVYKYNIVVNMDISLDMINEYVERKFLYWNLEHPHVKNIQVNGKELFLAISPNGNLSDSLSRSLDYIFIDNE